MIFCVGAFYVVATNRKQKYSFYKKSIWTLTFFEIATGVAIVVLNPVSLVNFCVSLSFYLALIFSVQFLLYYKSGKIFASKAA